MGEGDVTTDRREGEARDSGSIVPWHSQGLLDGSLWSEEISIPGGKHHVPGFDVWSVELEMAPHCVVGGREPTGGNAVFSAC